LQERPDLFNVFGRFFETFVIEVPLDGVSDHAIVRNAAIPDPDEQVSILSPIALEVLIVAIDLDETPGGDGEVRSEQVSNPIALE
jgi:hypothetical protein